VKTTVELPDDLARQVKAEAALRGRKLKDLVEEGLRLVLESPREARTGARPTLHDLMKDSCGIFNSGLPDLASNPKHLKSFGRATRPASQIPRPADLARRCVHRTCGRAIRAALGIYSRLRLLGLSQERPGAAQSDFPVLGLSMPITSAPATTAFKKGVQYALCPV